ncbi:hypothetical protein FIE12Z_10413 [Fusarium flagelliforme]|uniref:Hsp70 protein n=1 Tax=Fusarium flagelliforme TaxID=2675880 RepID=A0A395MBW1_9HYPO|nr:hypothetical protein FIE12Z_10413 [Fusarium flagelliforme]
MNRHDLDLRIAVDFGTTFTGVSWDTPKELNNLINIIDIWPGESRAEKKVPTILSKNTIEGKRAWGFQCRHLAEDEKWKLFKLLLDPTVHQEQLDQKAIATRRKKNGKGNGSWIPEEMKEVRKIVVQYLTQIYIHISQTIPQLIESDSFSQELRDKTWASMKVEFTFSTPTTWVAPVSQCFRSLVLKAGFGQHDTHSVILGLTEAEAAAVSAANDVKIMNNNILLSIDAGGGTTDLAFVRFINNSFTLEEIHPVTGIGVGSTKIDSEFAKLIEERIDKNPSVRLPSDFARKASQSDDFQDCKHKFGLGDCEHVVTDYSTAVARGDNWTHGDFGIQEGVLSFTSAELKQCFDITLEKIKQDVSNILEDARNYKSAMATMHVDYIVISGGLGSSAYVLKQLKTYINSLACEKDSCVAGASVVQVENDAQMVVVKGLLHDRRTNDHTLRQYVARANYAIVKNIPSKSTASAAKSAGEKIDWLVKYGDTIKACKPTTIRITRILAKAGPWRWTEEIMWLGGKRSHLPTSRQEGKKRGMNVLHKVDLETHPGTKLESVRRWWGPTKHYKTASLIWMYDKVMVISEGGSVGLLLVTGSLSEGQAITAYGPGLPQVNTETAFQIFKSTWLPSRSTFGDDGSDNSRQSIKRWSSLG